MAPTILARKHREPVGERRLLLGREGQARDDRRDARCRGIASIEGHISSRPEQNTAQWLRADDRRKGHHAASRQSQDSALSIRFFVAKLAQQVEDVHRLRGRRLRTCLLSIAVWNGRLRRGRRRHHQDGDDETPESPRGPDGGSRSLTLEHSGRVPSRAGEKTYVRSWRGGPSWAIAVTLLGRVEFAGVAGYTYFLTELPLMLIAIALFRRQRPEVIVPAA